MIDADAIAGIVTTYEKHGWILRRVLLTKDSHKKLHKDKSGLFGDVDIFVSTIDAAWFSRPPKSGGTVWELRYLGNIPYALLENLDENSAEFENNIRAVELRLREAVSSKTSA